MTYTIIEFTHEIESIFDLNFLKEERYPIDMGEYKFSSFPEIRVNHYLIKSNDKDEFNFGEIDNKEIQGLVYSLYKKSIEFGINLKNRYCFLTIDQGIVEPNRTLRNDGWHLDGLQGDEVQVKKKVDCEFIWSDCLPTTFSNQKIDIENLNISEHNVFNWISNQIKKESIISTKENHIYMINPYHIHTATKATEKIYRKFIRVAFTEIPVTSTKMTINPSITYNYLYHTTSGEIPNYLK